VLPVVSFVHVKSFSERTACSPGGSPIGPFVRLIAAWWHFGKVAKMQRGTTVAIIVLASGFAGRAWAIPTNPVKVVDVIPFNQSLGEQGDNSEPSIMVNPANPSQVMISSFADNGNNPYFVSTNGGTDWSQAFTIQHQDTTLSWGNNGKAYLTYVDNANAIQLMSSSTPLASPNSFSNINFPAPGVDQPAIFTTSVGATDYAYVGYNTGAGNDIEYSKNANSSFLGVPLATWNNVNLPIMAGASAAVSVRLAGSGNTVYAAYEQSTGTTGAGGAGDLTGGTISVVRSINGGTDNFAANGANGKALTSPSGVGAITIPFGDPLNAANPNPGTTLGNSPTGTGRLGSDLSIAVNPYNTNQVYVAYAAVVGGNPQITVKESLNGGETWANSYTVAGPSALPALAVASSGEVGLLETDYSAGPKTLDTWFYQLAPDLSSVGSLQELATFPDGTPAGTTDPYIGDYEGLTTQGANFYGTFSASNNPILADFPQGVYYDRLFTVGADNFTGQLFANATLDAPANSIDPFFFSTAALPEPGALSVLLGLGMITGLRRRGKMAR
jgi:hypothetical protein